MHTQHTHFILTILISTLCSSLLYFLPCWTTGSTNRTRKSEATRTRQSPVLTTLAREEMKKGTATLRDDDETYNIAKGSGTLGKTLWSPNDNYFRPDMPLTNTEYLSSDAQGGMRNEGRANHLPILLLLVSRDFQLYLDKRGLDRWIDNFRRFEMTRRIKVFESRMFENNWNSIIDSFDISYGAILISRFQNSRSKT